MHINLMAHVAIWAGHTELGLNFCLPSKLYICANLQNWEVGKNEQQNVRILRLFEAKYLQLWHKLWNWWIKFVMFNNVYTLEVTQEGLKSPSNNEFLLVLAYRRHQLWLTANHAMLWGANFCFVTEQISRFEKQGWLPWFRNRAPLQQNLELF